MIIKIEQNMDCGRICKVIEKLLRKEGDLTNKAVSITIVEMTESTAHIPKLEHKE